MGTNADICITYRKQCREQKVNCTCEAKCQNCGVLDKKKCQCKCKHGYDRNDCSARCQNDDGDCPDKFVYRYDPNLKNYTRVKGIEACSSVEIHRHRFCRKFCGTCQDFKPFDVKDPLSGPCCKATDYLKCRKNERVSMKTCNCVQIDEFGFLPEQARNLYLEPNKWRSKVIPTAANLHWIQFSSSRAVEAKIFTDKCEIPHRTETELFQETWFFSWTTDYIDEYENPLEQFYTKFDYATETCAPGAKDCEFFKNMISDNFFWMGCSRNSKCQNQTDFAEITVCVLEYSNNMKPIYLAGRPCSRCVKEGEYFCHQNLCIPKWLCEKNKFSCSCETQCKNCGTLDKATCGCICVYGYNHVDCSEPCKDLFPNCSTLIGYGYLNKPLRYYSQMGKEVCGLNEKFTLQQCRKLCGKCEDPKQFHRLDPRTKKCCLDMKCPKGMIHDFEECECLPGEPDKHYTPEFDIKKYIPDAYCPGKKIGKKNSKKSSKKNSADYVAFSFLFQFIAIILSVTNFLAF